MDSLIATPRGSAGSIGMSTPLSAREPRGGAKWGSSKDPLKAVNRNILGNLDRILSGQIAEGEVSSYAPSLAGKYNLSELSQQQSKQLMSKQEFEKARKRKEAAVKLQKLNELRKQDEALIKEKCSRLQRLRDQRCEEKLVEILSEEGFKAEANRIVFEHDDRQFKLKQDMYSQWDAEVAQRIEHQVLKFHLPVPPPEPAHFNGRARLRPSDDPLKSILRQQEEEDGFRRAADHILNTPRDQSVAEQVRRRQLIQESVAQRDKCRPMLPVPMWEQRQHYASHLGYFVQSCERGGPHHSARRMGVNAHRIDESDGVEAAGKTKSRFENKRLGMLAGTLAKEGEAWAHKRPDGRGSGAPMQDHYNYERGNDAVEAEMPVGKRIYPMLRA